MGAPRPHADPRGPTRARTGPDGDPVLLKDQDRSKWDAALVEEGTALVVRAFATKEVGAFAIQGAMAAQYAAAKTAAATDWQRIARL